MAKSVEVEKVGQDCFVTFNDLPVGNETLTVTLLVSADATSIDSVAVLEGINATRLAALPWKDISKRARQEAYRAFMGDVLDTGVGMDHAKHILRNYRPDTDEWLLTAAAICRWAIATGQPQAQTLADMTGKSLAMANVYRRRIKDKFEETGDLSYDIEKGD